MAKNEGADSGVLATGHKLTGAERAEYDELCAAAGALGTALSLVHRRMAALVPPPAADKPYRVALRPDDPTADPMDIATLLDDIVVKDVPMFRAEQMTPTYWWVACYLNDDERICWSVRARGRPLRIEWVTTEFPDNVTYEHDHDKEKP